MYKLTSLIIVLITLSFSDDYTMVFGSKSAMDYAYIAPEHIGKKCLLTSDSSIWRLNKVSPANEWTLKHCDAELPCTLYSGSELIKKSTLHIYVDTNFVRISFPDITGNVSSPPNILILRFPYAKEIKRLTKSRYIPVQSVTTASGGAISQGFVSMFGNDLQFFREYLSYFNVPLGIYRGNYTFTVLNR